MTRLLILAWLITTMLGVGGWDLSMVRADDELRADYIEEASPAEPSLTDTDSEANAATDSSSVNDSANDPSNEAQLGEPNPSAGDRDDAARLRPESEDEPDLEVIYERYPNRTVKIERSVSQDANGNYVNDGRWRMWDQTGAPAAEGRYRNGQREGLWTRWYRAAEVELLTKPPYNSFQGPFISQATFVDGKLDGTWTIYDSKQHKVCQREFVEGQRDGHYTWWFNNGRKMREIEYRHGEIDGQLIEWSIDGKVVTKETYQHGRKLATRLEKDAAGGKKTEGQYLFAKEVEKTSDDWWNAQPATFIKQGNDEKHGPWVSWYPNGQRQIEGEYRNDVQVGKFTWWYANGQKALEGAYVDGEQQGKWVWWNENGQKSVQGEYAKGDPTRHWTWWGEDGMVARSSQMDGGAGAIVQLPEKRKPLSPVYSAAKPSVPNGTAR